MGFRKDAFATVWSIEPKSDTMTRGRISINRKNRQTGEYEQDFSGFVDFIGTAAARSAASLKERDRIKLGDVDVTNKYDKEKNVTYTNFKIFSFEVTSGGNGAKANSNNTAPQPDVDDGDVDDSRLPF